MKLSIEDLNKMNPVEILDNEQVKERFISLFEKIHGGSGDHFYEKERFNFLKLIQAKPDLQQCTGFSIYGCFLDIAQNGLTLEQGPKALMYILPYNVEVVKGQKWEKRAKLEISPYGELVMRLQAGQLSHADKPVIVYKGDIFQPAVKNGVKTIDYSPKIPRESKTIIGGFIGLTRSDGSRDFFWMLPDDVDRLKKYSEKKNKGKANALYNSYEGGIDSGFLEAKILKHAFSCFPRLKVGQFSTLSTEEPDEMAYGLDIKPEQLPQKPVYETQYTDDEPETETEDYTESQDNEPETIVIQENNDIF
jgi:recombinational DNA repair protein RecT